MPKTGRGNAKGTVNFFISYTGADAAWAKWVAWELSRRDYTYRLQAEHIPPGARFMREMRRFLEDADHVIPILSTAYFKSEFASLEMEAALADDPTGEARRVIPVRVQPCDIPKLFRDLVYIDFVGKPEAEQRSALIAGVRAAIGLHKGRMEVSRRPDWPGVDQGGQAHLAPAGGVVAQAGSPLRVQFFASDVGRGLDLKGQYGKIQAAVANSRCADQIDLRPEFELTDSNLLDLLHDYRPNVVHLSGNQNGGDVLFPSVDGAEVIVPDEALAGLLSSLGSDVRLAIIDTCKSYRCAKRVSEVVDCAIGVEDDIYDDEAIAFYQTFYKAVGAGHSVKDAHGQAVFVLKSKDVPSRRIPKLCPRKGVDPSQMFLVRAGS